MVRPRPGADDPLRRGRLVLRQHGVTVELVSGEGVFSAAGVDPGTRFLLRWLAAADAERVLDLGCGYGPLGLWLAAAGRAGAVLAVDRDAVALACTDEGAARNGLEGRVETHGSLGYDDVAPDRRFDLVVSNVPAKVGPAALRHLLLDGWYRLGPGGRMAVVVVDRLAVAVGDLLAGDPAVLVDDHHANPGYASWIYRFDRAPLGADVTSGFERGVYRRGTARFGAGGLGWEATTSFTLPEFDTLSHASTAAVELLERRPLTGPVGLVGVGQGHLALAVRATSGSETALRLVDRDLLALRTAAANLGGAGDMPETRHVATPAGALGGCRAAVVALPEKQPVAVTATLLGAAVADLPAGAPVLVHGRAADVARVLDLLGRRGTRLRIEDRRAQHGGTAALTVTPPA